MSVTHPRVCGSQPSDSARCCTRSEETALWRKEVEVAVVGNGPSAILLSLLLSGYQPYFTGTHPNPYLTKKLLENKEKSLLEQDLEYLSEGLEGRSQNSIALLFDTLLRPNTDLDEMHSSSLCWEHDPSKAVPHIIVGRGNPGGCWQYMDPTVKTLSLHEWLELPLYSFEQWKLDRGGLGDAPVDRHCRVLCGEVAMYYADYIKKMGLEENFVGDLEISQIYQETDCYSLSVSPSPTNSSPSSGLLLSPTSPSHHECPAIESTLPIALEKLTQIRSSQSSESEDCGIVCHQSTAPKLSWHLRGSQKSTGTPNIDICISSQVVVLACGVYDNPRHLDVPGEREAEFLTYRLPDFSKRLAGCAAAGTVLVVGAGLSAADAVLLALKNDVKVVHVFEQDPKDQRLIFSRMPKEFYPGYTYVHALMLEHKFNPSYFCRAQYQVVHFQSSAVSITNGVHEEGIEGVDLGGVFIGSNAELSFMPEDLAARLGTASDKPVNAKRNPVAVNPTSFVTEAASSLYAVGSLVGDNFVRFGVGSSLGAAQHIMRRNL